MKPLIFCLLFVNTAFAQVLAMETLDYNIIKQVMHKG